MVKFCTLLKASRFVF